MITKIEAGSRLAQRVNARFTINAKDEAGKAMLMSLLKPIMDGGAKVVRDAKYHAEAVLTDGSDELVFDAAALTKMLAALKSGGSEASLTVRVSNGRLAATYNQYRE